MPLNKETKTHQYFFYYHEGSLRDVEATELDCKIIVSEIKPLLRVTFRQISLGKA